MTTFDSTTSTKRCTKCGEIKHLDQFSRHKNRKDGHCGECKACALERTYKWRDANPDKAKKHRHTTYINNREKVLEYSNRRHKENPEKHREDRIRWQKKHPESVKQAAIRWREKHPEQAKEAIAKYKRNHPERVQETQRKYWAANLDKARIKESRRRARKKSLPNTFTAEQWRSCLSYWNGCCAYCGNQQGSSIAMQICADHFIPLSVSHCPGTVRGNMIPACRGCNSSKLDLNATEWLTANLATIH